MSPPTPSRRVAGTAALFGGAIVCLALAAATHAVWPLFVAWIPLIGVPWLLTRRAAGDVADAPLVDQPGDDVREADVEPRSGAAETPDPDR